MTMATQQYMVEQTSLRLTLLLPTTFLLSTTLLLQHMILSIQPYLLETPVLP
jgi:hypothetical protein